MNHTLKAQKDLMGIKRVLTEFFSQNFLRAHSILGSLLIPSSSLDFSFANKVIFEILQFN